MYVMGKFATAIVLSLIASGVNSDCLSEAERYLQQATLDVDCDTEPAACRGAFDLGAPKSREVFESLHRQMSACSGLVSATRDKGVNHPDFYDAWEFRFQDGAIVVSIKDKAALGATYLVLRRLP